MAIHTRAKFAQDSQHASMSRLRSSKPNMVRQTNFTVVDEYFAYLEMLVAGLQRGVMIICGLICLRGWRWGRNSSPLRGSQGNEGRRKGGTKEGRLGLLVRLPDLLMAMCSPMTLWWTRGECLLVRDLACTQELASHSILYYNCFDFKHGGRL